jgi:hypothetical protein
MYVKIFKTTQQILVWVFWIEVIQEESIYVYNMRNIVDKYFNMSIAPVRRRDGSLVLYKNV